MRLDVGAPTLRIAFTASASPAARTAVGELRERYGDVALGEAEVIVAVGGDGAMIDTLHRVLALPRRAPVFGMTRGTTGFLMNGYAADGLDERIARAVPSTIFPLRMRAFDVDGHPLPEQLACNEVALRRMRGQSARLRIIVDDEVRVPELVGDGVLVATPAGSTAYNRSAHGRIVPLDAGLLAFTATSPCGPAAGRAPCCPVVAWCVSRSRAR